MDVSESDRVAHEEGAEEEMIIKNLQELRDFLLCLQVGWMIVIGKTTEGEEERRRGKREQDEQREGRKVRIKKQKKK